MEIKNIITDLPRNGRPTQRKESKIDLIVVHNDGVPAPAESRVMERLRTEAYYTMHKFNAHSISYHFVISPKGVIYKCNAITDLTAHAGSTSTSAYPNANTRGIAITCMGNFNESRPTALQLASLDWLIGELLRSMPGIKHVIGHRDVRHGTDCPGRNFTDAMIPHYCK